MSITYPITLPTAPRPREITMRSHNVVGVAVSPFTGHQHVYKHPGEFWSVDVVMPPMKRANAEKWLASITSLAGASGSFYMTPYGHETPQGVATGTPLVAGSSQSGDDVFIDGLTPSTNGIFKAGDFFSLGGYLYKILTDANSDSSGQTWLNIWPSLRGSPADDAPLTTTDPTGIFRLASNDVEFTVGAAEIYGFGFSAVELL